MFPGNEFTSFGAYVFVVPSTVLMKGIEVVDLPQRQLQVLAVLLSADGKVVHRETLMDLVWREVCVEDHNLTQTIFLLRRSLGKLPSGFPYIETVPGTGYRIAEAALRMKPTDVNVAKASNRSQSDWWLSLRQRVSCWLSTLNGSFATDQQRVTHLNKDTGAGSW